MLFTNRKTYCDRLCIMEMMIRNSILLLANSFILLLLQIAKYFCFRYPQNKSNSYDGFNR